MIEEFTRAWFENMHTVRADFEAKHPDDYKSIVRAVVNILPKVLHDQPDPERIHQIDDGRYQGTLVFVIVAKGWAPDAYWYCRIYYGSCSACDTLEAIHYGGDKTDKQKVDKYMTLALHVVQNIRPMSGEVVS